MELWFPIAVISSLVVIATLIITCFVTLLIEDQIGRGIGK